MKSSHSRTVRACCFGVLKASRAKLNARPSSILFEGLQLLVPYHLLSSQMEWDPQHCQLRKLYRTHNFTTWECGLQLTCETRLAP